MTTHNDHGGASAAGRRANARRRNCQYRGALGSFGELWGAEGPMHAARPQSSQAVKGDVGANRRPGAPNHEPTALAAYGREGRRKFVGYPAASPRPSALCPLPSALYRPPSALCPIVVACTRPSVDGSPLQRAPREPLGRWAVTPACGFIVRCGIDMCRVEPAQKALDSHRARLESLQAGKQAGEQVETRLERAPGQSSPPSTRAEITHWQGNRQSSESLAQRILRTPPTALCPPLISLASHPVAPLFLFLSPHSPPSARSCLQEHSESIPRPCSTWHPCA